MRAALTVGGIEVALTVPKGPQEAIMAERYSPFLGAIVDPICDVEFVDNGVEKGLPNPPSADVVSNDTKVRVDHVDFDADLDLEGDGQVRVPADPYVIDHFFRLVIGLLAPRHESLMLHACGVISEGRSHVFAGESGAGKSTLASLAEHRPLLSDEHVIVRRVDGEWRGASTPFWGAYAKPSIARDAPLETLWSLRQWPSNRVKDLEPFDTVRIAVENAVVPSSEPHIKRAVFEVATELAASVKSKELRFVPVTTVWEHIDELAVV